MAHGNDSNMIELALQKKALQEAIVKDTVPRPSTQRRKAFGVSLSQSSARKSPIARQVLDRHRVVVGDKLDIAHGEIDLLCTQVLQEMAENGWRTLGITSPMPRCGKSTLAVNLAIGLAQRALEGVVLVDFDLRNPTVGKYLGIDAKPGLSDYLRGEAPFDAALVNPGIQRLLVLPNETPVANPYALLATSEAMSVMQRLKTANDLQAAVVDLPPLLHTDDALALLPHIDCLLIVVADGVSKKSELEEIRQLVKRVNVLGFVLNCPIGP